MTESRKPLCFAVVANVAAEVYGHGGPSAGTKHFSAGTKVYCERPRWGDGGERLWVVGRHRRSPQLIRIIMPSDRLVNWRAQAVYHGGVDQLLHGHWRDKETAAAFAASANKRRPPAGNVQAAGKLATQCYRLIEAGGPAIDRLAYEAVTDSAALRRLADWLDSRGAGVPIADLAAMVLRRARRRG